jgi:hypothetical protein
MKITGNSNKFLNYTRAIIKNTGKLGKMKNIMIVKYRLDHEGKQKIDVDIYNDINEFSGILNSGTIFTQNTFLHEFTPESLKKWHIVLQERSEELFEALAEENGTEAVFTNDEIQEVINHKIGRTIFKA